MTFHLVMQMKVSAPNEAKHLYDETIDNLLHFFNAFHITENYLSNFLQRWGISFLEL